MHTKKEYDRLYNLYFYNRLLENVAKVENTNTNVKALKAENKSLKEKLGNKCLEFKQLKCDHDNLHQDNNALSVSLKAAKADN